MSSDYTPHPPGQESPPVRGQQWTPSDSADLPFVTRGFNIAEAGALKVDWYEPDGEGGFTRVTETIPSGQYSAGLTHPARWIKIWATGTDLSAVGIRR